MPPRRLTLINQWVIANSSRQYTQYPLLKLSNFPALISFCGDEHLNPFLRTLVERAHVPYELLEAAPLERGWVNGCCGCEASMLWLVLPASHSQPPHVHGALGGLGGGGRGGAPLALCGWPMQGRDGGMGGGTGTYLLLIAPPLFVVDLFQQCLQGKGGRAGRECRRNHKLTEVPR